MNRSLAVLAGTMSGLMILGMSGCKADSTDPNGAGPPPPDGTSNTVVMSSMSFAPANLTVATGTTITWRNTDAIVHTSTSDSTRWDTGNIQPGTSGTTVFNTPGIFRYHCRYHRAMGMVGTITVQ